MAEYKSKYTGEEIDTAIGKANNIDDKEDKTNKVTSLSSESTDKECPSAKCVYDLVGDVETLLEELR
jgi:3-methyladenine DNA glycosylase AlkC